MIADLAFSTTRDRDNFRAVEDDELAGAEFKDDEGKSTEGKRIDRNSDIGGTPINGRYLKLDFADKRRGDSAYNRFHGQMNRPQIISGHLSIHDCFHDELAEKWVDCSKNNYEENAV